jgi:serine/threonine protein phosphatase 1
MNFRDTYVMGDLHGNYKGMVQAIERSPFDPAQDRLITIGDYIDGGAHIEVLPVMEYLMNLPNWIGILGNHDAWALDAISENWINIEDIWYHQGGKSTLESMGIGTNLVGHHRVFGGYPPPIFSAFLNSLIKYYIDDDNNAYVHAGWKNQQHKIENSLSFQMDGGSDLYWNREFWNKAGSNAYPDNPYNKVFIGHSQSYSYPEKRKNVWNIDSGAGYDGYVTIMNVDTEEFWKSDATSELYENFGFRD